MRRLLICATALLATATQAGGTYFPPGAAEAARQRLIQYVDDNHQTSWFSVERACGRAGPLGIVSPISQDECATVVSRRVSELRPQKQADAPEPRPPNKPAAPSPEQMARDAAIESGKLAPETSRDFSIANKADLGLCSVWLPSLDDKGKAMTMTGRVSHIQSPDISVGVLAMPGYQDHMIGAFAGLACSSNKGQPYFLLRMTGKTKRGPGYRLAAGGNFTVVARHAGLSTYADGFGDVHNVPIYDVLFIGRE